MDIESTIKQFAEERIKDELDRARRECPERLEKLLNGDPDHVAAWKARMHAETRQIAESILDKDSCCVKLRRGAFHPSNKMTRKMFTTLTGVVLPPGPGATNEVVANYIGRDRIAAAEAKDEAKRAEQEQVAHAKRVAKETANIGRIEAAVVADSGIDGEDLLVLARHLGIEVHPRTAGMLRKRVRSIRSGTASVGKGGSVQSAFELYHQCAARCGKPDAQLQTA